MKLLKYWTHGKLIFAGSFAAISLLLPAAALGATITVDTTADSFGDDQTCSLRAAIESANTDSAIDGCLAGEGADTIVLQSGKTYRFSRSGADGLDNETGDLWIDSELTIETDDSNAATIDADAMSRVFFVTENGDATLKGLSIRGGLVNPGQGGGILNQGTLTLLNSQVFDNQAIGSAGELQGGGFGGGIYNEGMLYLSDSSIHDNLAEGGRGQDTVSGRGSGGGGGAGLGGGIYNKGTVELTRTDLESNVAVGGAGGNHGECGSATGDGGNGGGDGGAGGLGNDGSGADGGFGGGGGGGGSREGKGGDGGFGGGGGGAGAQSTGGSNPDFGVGGFGGGDGGIAEYSCEAGGGGGAGLGGAIFNDGGHVEIGAGSSLLFNDVVGGDKGDGFYEPGHGSPGQGIASSLFNHEGSFACDFLLVELDLDGSFYLGESSGCFSELPFHASRPLPDTDQECPEGYTVTWQVEAPTHGIQTIDRSLVCNEYHGEEEDQENPTLLSRIRDLDNVDAGSISCPHGGYHFEAGRDLDGDGELSDDEVETTTSFCHDPVNPSDSSSGCSATGQKDPPLSMLTILAFLTLVAALQRRRRGPQNA